VEGDEVAYAREATDFPGIEMILRIDTEVTKAGSPVRREARHMVTSLGGDEVSPRRLMGLARGHWGVENGLHFIKDRWWDEDRQWSVRPGLAERLASLSDCPIRVPGVVEGG
jgi:hypothetical protein